MLDDMKEVLTKELTERVTKEVTEKVTDRVAKTTSKKIAKKLLVVRVDIDMIVSATGLGKEEVEGLR